MTTLCLLVALTASQPGDYFLNERVSVRFGTLSTVDHIQFAADKITVRRDRVHVGLRIKNLGDRSPFPLPVVVCLTDRDGRVYRVHRDQSISFGGLPPGGEVRHSLLFFMGDLPRPKYDFFTLNLYRGLPINVKKPWLAIQLRPRPGPKPELTPEKREARLASLQRRLERTTSEATRKRILEAIEEMRK